MEETIMEPFFYVFTPEDIKDMVADALDGRAAFYESEIRAEDLKGAGNQGKVQSMRWGQSQLKEIAEIIRTLPDGELRERPSIRPFGVAGASGVVPSGPASPAEFLDILRLPDVDRSKDTIKEGQHIFPGIDEAAERQAETAAAHASEPNERLMLDRTDGSVVVLDNPFVAPAPEVPVPYIPEFDVADEADALEDSQAS